MSHQMPVSDRLMSEGSDCPDKVTTTLAENTRIQNGAVLDCERDGFPSRRGGNLSGKPTKCVCSSVGRAPVC